jgi:hypothetical protein
MTDYLPPVQNVLPGIPPPPGPPGPKRSKRRIRYLLIGLLICVGVGVAAYAIFQGTKPLRQLGSQFLNACAQGRIDEAASLSTTEFGGDRCQEISEWMAGKGPLKWISVNHVSASYKDGLKIGEVGGEIGFTKGGYHFKVSMERQNGVWKVTALAVEQL